MKLSVWTLSIFDPPSPFLKFLNFICPMSDQTCVLYCTSCSVTWSHMKWLSATRVSSLSSRSGVSLSLQEILFSVVEKLCFSLFAGSYNTLQSVVLNRIHHLGPTLHLNNVHGSVQTHRIHPAKYFVSTVWKRFQHCCHVLVTLWSHYCTSHKNTCWAIGLVKEAAVDG